MSKVLPFVRLDFITVKPYFTLKNLVIIMAAPLLIFFTSGGNTSAIGLFVVFASLYVSYPFVICEKNNMDVLYFTLSITRKTVVLGRYLFALAFDLCAALMGIILTLAAFPLVSKTVNLAETLVTLAVLLVVVTLIEAVQLPIYFKLGYEKAKMLAYLPFIGTMLLVLVFDRLVSYFGSLAEQILDWFAANPAIAIAIAVVIWLGIMVISVQTSVAYYRKRDF